MRGRKKIVTKETEEVTEDGYVERVVEYRDNTIAERTDVAIFFQKDPPYADEIRKRCIIISKGYVSLYADIVFLSEPHEKDKCKRNPVYKIWTREQLKPWIDADEYVPHYNCKYSLPVLMLECLNRYTGTIFLYGVEMKDPKREAEWYTINMLVSEHVKGNDRLRFLNMNPDSALWNIPKFKG